METFPISIHKQLIPHTYAKFHSQTKRVKSLPTFVHVSSAGINEDVHETRITQQSSNREQISTIKKFETSFHKVIPTPVDSRKPTSDLSLLENIFKTLDRAIMKFLDPPHHLSVDSSYILSGNYAPVDELSPTKCELIHGLIPPCLDGVYIRNGPNPQFVSDGPHHYLDGDGMVHSIRISKGEATFCSRYVKTNKYLSEHHVRSSVVPNVIGGMQAFGPFIARAILFVVRVVLGHYNIRNGIGVANTSLAFFGGSLYALCESDLPYALKVKENGDIITLGHHDFDGELSLNMTAHPKIDPETKETFAFRYWATHPYLTYFHFDANGNKQPDVPIFSMKQSSITHDLAITKKYAIICDLKLVVDPMNLIRGAQLVSVDPTKVPRIGVLPRYAKDESDMKWFNVPGFNIFHAVNAWDETDDDGGGDVVVLVAPNILSVEHFLERPDLIQPFIEKVSIYCKTGIVSRHVMSTDNMEFPVINPAYVAKKSKFVYATISEKTPIMSRMVRVVGVAKLEIATSEDKEPHEGMVATRMYRDNCFGGEPFFVARDHQDPNSEEDDGYLVSYVHDESLGVSRFLVMDARSPTLDVVAEVKLPQRVPYGLHGIFIREKDLNHT